MRKKLSLILATVFTFSVLATGDFNNKYAKADMVGSSQTLNTSTTLSSKVGQTLLEKEDGWERFDDVKTEFKYSQFEPSVYNYNFDGEYKLTSTKGATVKFNFYGTKLRVISPRQNIFSDNITIKVDGVEEKFSEKSSALEFRIVVYEKLNLPLNWHTVEIITNDSAYVGFDAIDIDSTGKIAEYNAVLAKSISLNKTSLEMAINDEDTLISTVLPENAENKKVFWTVSNEGVVNFDPATGKVKALKEGNVTITAKVEGTDLIATCNINVTANSANRAILSITLVNGVTKEYEVSATELSGFIKWFDESNGKGQLKHEFKKTIKPYKVVKEYIVFDKIASYEVREFESLDK